MDIFPNRNKNTREPGARPPVLPVGDTFRRTTSCAPFARSFNGKPAVNPALVLTNRTFSPADVLIQAAFLKAVLTNTSLADVLFPSRLAGASRSGACTSQPPSPNTDLSWSAIAQGSSALGEMDGGVGISKYH